MAQTAAAPGATVILGHSRQLQMKLAGAAGAGGSTSSKAVVVVATVM